MRVLFMGHLYTPRHNAGAEMMVHNLLRELAHHGHTVDALLSRQHPDITGPYDIDGVQVHPYQGKGDPFRFLADEDRKPHVIVTHLENTERAGLLGSMHNVPVVHVLHNTFADARNALWHRKPALAVYNTQWMRTDYETWWTAEHESHPMPRGVVVHPPIEPGEYTTTPGDHVTLVNLYEPKGVDLFYALAERFPSKKFLGVKGAYGTQVVRDLPNVEIVEHLPGQDMRDKVYARTKVLLVPSEYESYGRVAVEAACSGIPTIAHPTLGLLESLGSAGTFVDRSDVGGWEKELKRLLSPRGWAAPSKRATDLATSLDPKKDLALWVKTVTEVAGVSAR